MPTIIGPVRKGECKKCGKCCMYDRITVPHATPEEKEYYSKRAAQLWEVDDGFVIIIHNRCPYLAEDNTCSIYGTDEYPKVCRNYPADEESLFIEDCGFYFEIDEMVKY